MDFVANVREMVVLMIAVVAARAVSSWLAILEGGGHLDGVTVTESHIDAVDVKFKLRNSRKQTLSQYNS